VPRLLTVLLIFSATAFAADGAPESALPPAPSANLVAVAPRKLPEVPSHRFFDRTNISLHVANALLQTGDLISTRQIMDRGGRETSPLARPFVNGGIGGQMVASYVIGTGGTLLGSYLLHRTGHHRLERWLPISVMTMEGLATISNARLLQRGHLRGR
jgi:hypothetical protein